MWVFVEFRRKNCFRTKFRNEHFFSIVSEINVVADFPMFPSTFINETIFFVFPHVEIRKKVAEMFIFPGRFCLFRRFQFSFSSFWLFYHSFLGLFFVWIGNNSSIPPFLCFLKLKFKICHESSIFVILVQKGNLWSPSRFSHSKCRHAKLLLGKWENSCAPFFKKLTKMARLLVEKSHR